MTDKARLTAVYSFLRHLEDSRYYGTVEIKFQDGGVSHILQHTSLKTHDLVVRPDHRTQNDNTEQQ